MTDLLSLGQICSVYNTDKNNYHSYVDELYEKLFADIRPMARKVLEIGVDTGASLLMWREYFYNATITGVDLKRCPVVQGRDKIITIEADAYDQQFIASLPNDFDIIIDDGPHTLSSIRIVIEQYSHKLNANGILVIEDLQDFHWCNILRPMTPPNFNFEVADLRRYRGRYDDIAIVIRPNIRV